MTIGILAAMHEEIADLLAEMKDQSAYTSHRIGMRDYCIGELHGQACVVVLARVGKVAAAATAATLIREFGVSEVIFTGLAGGIAPGVNVGDVIVGDRLVQDDLDARPFFRRFEVPLLDLVEFPANGLLSIELQVAAGNFLQHDLPHIVKPEALLELGITKPAIHIGLVASGDQFVGSGDDALRIRELLPAAIAVEMEGAAVAQVCHEYDVPFALLRTISDQADGNAHVDFSKFLARIASQYSAGIISRFLRQRITLAIRTSGAHHK